MTDAIQSLGELFSQRIASARGLAPGDITHEWILRQRAVMLAAYDAEPGLLFCSGQDFVDMIGVGERAFRFGGEL